MNEFESLILNMVCGNTLPPMTESRKARLLNVIKITLEDFAQLQEITQTQLKQILLLHDMKDICA